MWPELQHIESVKGVGLTARLSTVHPEGVATVSERSNANRSVFVAGAAGAIGRQLLPMLVGVWVRGIPGPPANPGKTTQIEAVGARPVLVDVFDRASLITAVKRGEAGSDNSSAHRSFVSEFCRNRSSPDQRHTESGRCREGGGGAPDDRSEPRDRLRARSGTFDRAGCAC